MDLINYLVATMVTVITVFLLCLPFILLVAILMTPIILIIVLVAKSASNSKSVPRNYEEWRYGNNKRDQ